MTGTPGRRSCSGVWGLVMETDATGVRSIDLNADLGEGCPWDAPLLERVSSASIACGVHAGDEATSRATLLLARDRGVVVGAHPGYADREHFGRREREVDAAEVVRLIIEQVDW